jgi:ABC-type multidrug transport system permease subunit
MPFEQTATAAVAAVRGERVVGSGAGAIVLAAFFYALLAAPFCALVGARTSRRMGWLMAVPLVFLPLTLLAGSLVP